MTEPVQTSIRPARLPRVAALVFLVLCVLHQASAPGPAAAVETSARARASELVSQLGHQEFAMRERAAAELIALEVDAAAALTLGTNSRNREIRYRSAKLLALISQIDLERRFERFKKDTDPEQDYGLPGWNAYRKVVGNSPSARSLFVSMHEDEPSLLGRLEGDPKPLSDALADRCGKAMMDGVPIRIGTAATLLFAATREGVEVTPLVHSVVYFACRGSSFEAAIESGPLREVLATLAELWINRQSSQGITDALHLGLTNRLKGCLPRARKVFQMPAATVSDRVYACLCLCSFGDESDFAQLEAFLDDANICLQAQLNGQVVVTKMQDIALACLVRLAKQEPKDFGFDRVEMDRRLVFNLATLGFLDEQSRVQAIASWHEFRRSTAKPAP